MDAGSFFFQPLQLHLEAANLLVELVLERFSTRRYLISLRGENITYPFLELLLPLAHLSRVDTMLASNLVHRPQPFERFERYFGLEVPTVSLTLIQHRYSLPRRSFVSLTYLAV